MIVARGGDDTIHGLRGRDVIARQGSVGPTHIFGGPKLDRMFGGPSDDVIDGGPGGDWASGGGHDRGDVCVRVQDAPECEVRRP